MENQKKTIDSLKNEFVKGGEIKGGGMATSGPPMLPTGPGPIMASSEPILPGGQVVSFGGDPLSHPIDLGPVGDNVGDF